MVDIIIVRRKDRAIIIPETEKGRRWLIENIKAEASSAAAVSISNDVVSDFEEDLKKEGLEVESR